MLPEPVSYAAMVVFVTASFAGMAAVTDRISVEKERRAVLGLDLATNIRDLAPKERIREKDNAAFVYRRVSLSMSVPTHQAMMDLLDGRPTNRDVIRIYFSENAQALRLVTEASKRPRFHLTPDLGDSYLDEYEPLKFGAMAFAALAVLERSPDRLKVAASITKHAAEGSFRESARAHFLGRLYVLKAMDRLGVNDAKVIAQMGPEPNLKRVLRGELLHDLTIAKADPTFQSNMIMPMFGRTAEGRLTRLWHDAFPRIPGEPERYDEAVEFFTQFEARYRRRRVISRYFRDGYADLARLAQEARELRQRHEEVVVEQ